MELIKAKGLVLRSVNFGEYDKILTVLTENLGKISVMAKGAKSLKRGGSTSLNVFCYSDFVLYLKKDIYVMSQASGIECFFGLSSDLERLNCGTNIVQFSDFICQEQQESRDVLRIALNSLYALAALHKNPVQVNVAFCLKMLVVLGFEPELYYCAACGNEENLNSFSPSSGGVVCASCALSLTDKKKISKDIIKIMQYINSCDIKQMFKFDAGTDILKQAYEIICGFIEEHLDFKFKHEIFN